MIIRSRILTAAASAKRTPERETPSTSAPSSRSSTSHRRFSASASSPSKPTEKSYLSTTTTLRRRDMRTPSPNHKIGGFVSGTNVVGIAEEGEGGVRNGGGSGNSRGGRFGFGSSRFLLFSGNQEGRVDGDPRARKLSTPISLKTTEGVRGTESQLHLTLHRRPTLISMLDNEMLGFGCSINNSIVRDYSHPRLIH